MAKAKQQDLKGGGQVKLKEVIKAVSYTARLQVMKKDEYGYNYMFPKDDLITRETIEKFYPELLEMELSDGFHGEGIREGIYVHLKGE